MGGHNTVIGVLAEARVQIRTFELHILQMEGFGVPPALGYGSRGAGGVIKGGETLVFVVDLLSIG